MKNVENDEGYINVNNDYYDKFVIKMVNIMMNLSLILLINDFDFWHEDGYPGF